MYMPICGPDNKSTNKPTLEEHGGTLIWQGWMMKDTNSSHIIDGNAHSFRNSFCLVWLNRSFMRLKRSDRRCSRLHSCQGPPSHISGLSPSL